MSTANYALNIFSNETPKFKTYNIHNFRQLPEIQARLSAEDIFNIEVVANVFPFKVNSYVVEELIDWKNIPNDPIFRLTFPHTDMLAPDHFDQMASLLKNGADKTKIKETANEIRMQLNPHPAGQMEHNIPYLEEETLKGMQHKYNETILFFPSQGQTCHSYCTFCFRWPQFVGMDNYKFAVREVDQAR